MGAAPSAPACSTRTACPGDWYADRPGTVDPLGALWLVGLLVQLGLVWPLVLVPLRRLLGVRERRQALTRLLPVLVALAYGAWLVGPLRTAAGAPAAELAFGTHVRAAEFLLGAVAAVVVVGLHGRRIPAGVAPVLAVVGIGGLVALSVLATRHPVDWLRLGGPAGAAAAGALLLLAAQLPAHGPLAAALGRGLPLELGRAAYPLLLLHLPVFWLVQRGVPTVRPAALLLTGTALAWLVGLLLQDGLVRRWRAHWRRWASVPLVALAVLAVGAGGAGLFLRGTDVPPPLPGLLAHWPTTARSCWCSAAPPAATWPPRWPRRAAPTRSATPPAPAAGCCRPASPSPSAPG